MNNLFIISVIIMKGSHAIFYIIYHIIFTKIINTYVYIIPDVTLYFQRLLFCSLFTGAR